MNKKAGKISSQWRSKCQSKVCIYDEDADEDDSLYVNNNMSSVRMLDCHKDL